jgi:DNA invertase Pin-like site-specific DNA recombinase
MQTCAIYIRKSREDRDKPSHRLTVQREQLPAHARAQGWAVEVYDDGHASAARGKTDDLAERARLESDIRAGRVQVVLCIELSRLSRDDSMQDYVAWLHLCGQYGVKLATPARMLDPAQHSDWMLLLMEGGFSSVEMRVLQGRMAEGRAQAFRAGKYLAGNPPEPYIYDKGAQRLVVDPESLKKMQRLWSLAECHSAREVARQMDMPLIKVRRAIADDRLLFYQGLRKDEESGEIIQGQWPAVIDADQAQRIRANRKQGHRSARREAAGLLSNLGVFVCGYCGKSIRAASPGRARKDGTRLEYYGCTAKGYSRDCPQSRMIIQPIVDAKVTGNMLSTLERLEDLKAAWQAAQKSAGDNNAEALQGRINEIETKKKRLVAAIAEGVIDFADAKEQRQALEEKAVELRRQKKELEAQVQTEPEWDSLAITPEDWEALDFTERRELIRAAIAKITMFRNYLIIEYNFPRNADGTKTSRVHLPQPKKPAGNRQVYKL